MSRRSPTAPKIQLRRFSSWEVAERLSKKKTVSRSVAGTILLRFLADRQAEHSAARDLASLMGVTAIEVYQQARFIGVTYGTLRTWRSQKWCWQGTSRHIDAFIQYYLVPFLRRRQAMLDSEECLDRQLTQQPYVPKDLASAPELADVFAWSESLREAVAALATADHFDSALDWKLLGEMRRDDASRQLLYWFAIQSDIIPIAERLDAASYVDAHIAALRLARETLLNKNANDQQKKQAALMLSLAEQNMPELLKITEADVQAGRARQEMVKARVAIRRGEDVGDLEQSWRGGRFNQRKRKMRIKEKADGELSRSTPPSADISRTRSCCLRPSNRGTARCRAFTIH